MNDENYAYKHRMAASKARDVADSLVDFWSAQEEIESNPEPEYLRELQSNQARAFG